MPLKLLLSIDCNNVINLMIFQADINICSYDILIVRYHIFGHCGAECWSEVLRWSGVRFWSGKCWTKFCSHAQQDITGQVKRIAHSIQAIYLGVSKLYDTTQPFLLHRH